MMTLLLLLLLSLCIVVLHIPNNFVKIIQGSTRQVMHRNMILISALIFSSIIRFGDLIYDALIFSLLINFCFTIWMFSILV